MMSCVAARLRPTCASSVPALPGSPWRCNCFGPACAFLCWNRATCRTTRRRRPSMKARLSIRRCTARPTSTASGGSTTIWGGRCVPFDPIDLQTRPWIEYASWPIDYQTLAGFYPEANALCEAGEAEYDAGHALGDSIRPLIRGFAPSDFTTDRLERFSCPTDFGTRYRNRLAASNDVRVMMDANATRLLASADGTRVDRVLVRTLRGNRFHVRSRLVVLATGGIEVPRLLLASRDVHAQGMGNAEDLVGRFYMCHIAGTIGTLRLNGQREDVWHGYDVAEDGTYCRRRIALRAERQREHGIGNIVFRLHHPRIPDPLHRTGALSAIYLAKHFISYEYGKRLTGDQPAGVMNWLRH